MEWFNHISLIVEILENTELSLGIAKMPVYLGFSNNWNVWKRRSQRSLPGSRLLERDFRIAAWGYNDFQGETEEGTSVYRYRSGETVNLPQANFWRSAASSRILEVNLMFLWPG